MRKKILFIVLCLLVASISRAGNVVLDNNQIVRATVVHIFEDFSGKDALQKIAKVKISGTPANKELSLVEISSNISLKQGESIIISQLQKSDTFGMGDSFESKYTFVDYAKDSVVFWLLLSLLLPLILLLNRQAWPVASIIFVDLLLLGLVFLLFSFWRLPEYLFIIIFIGCNLYLFRVFYPSRKYWLGAFASTVSLICAGLFYTFLIKRFHLSETAWIANSSSYSLSSGLIPSSDSIAWVVLAFFIYQTTTQLFIRVSSQYRLVDSLRMGLVSLSTLYFFLGAGLLFPVLASFLANGLETLYLFNYFPFALNVVKLIVMFWGNFLSLSLYVLSIYLYRRKYPHTPLFGAEHFLEGVSLDHILEDNREAKYPPASHLAKEKSRKKILRVTKQAKAQAKPKRLTREHRRRI